MNIQETEIVGINYTNKVTIYTLEGKDKKYYFSVLPYSKESDFISNTFGATHDLKLGKTAYITLNDDKEMVKSIKEGLKRTGGYCPCRIQRTEENKCMCKEFRDQIADPNFEGFCHCMLYYKSKD